MDPIVKPISQTVDYIHDDIFAAVEPLTDVEINWIHPHLSNTIGILLRHIAGSERYWIGELAGGRPAQRVREAEFVREQLRKAPLVEGLRHAQALVQDVLGKLTGADLTQEVTFTWRAKQHRLTKAWAVLHSVHHSSYHLGQIQLFKKMATSQR